LDWVKALGWVPNTAKKKKKKKNPKNHVISYSVLQTFVRDCGKERRQAAGEKEET
jgi:hypothetical protein